jgi:hypothetical protein
MIILSFQEWPQYIILHRLTQGLTTLCCPIVSLSIPTMLISFFMPLLLLLLRLGLAVGRSDRIRITIIDDVALPTIGRGASPIPSIELLFFQRGVTYRIIYGEIIASLTDCLRWRNPLDIYLGERESLFLSSYC